MTFLKTKIINKLNNLFRVMRGKTGYVLLRIVVFLEKKLLKIIAILRNHPLPAPWINLKRGQNKLSSGQGRSSLNRVDTLISNIPTGCKTVVDIGANNCFFSIALSERGMHSICYEPDIEFLKVAFNSFYTTGKNIAISPMAINSKNVGMVPKADIFLVLSVAQRWLHFGGIKEFNYILSELVKKTNRIMFFEIPNPIDSNKEKKYLNFLGSNRNDFDQSIFKMFKEFGASDIVKIVNEGTDHNDDLRRDIYLVKMKNIND